MLLFYLSLSLSHSLYISLSLALYLTLCLALSMLGSVVHTVNDNSDVGEGLDVSLWVLHCII